MSIVVYGIPNCDTVKKARAWLDQAGVSYTFHDFKKSGVPAARLQAWAAAAGWEKLLNRQGTTWRKLDSGAQALAVDGRGATELMISQPSLIKRPVVEWRGDVTIGFDSAAWALRVNAG